MIICFAGGTAGDIVTALVDNKNCEINKNSGSVKIPKDRSLLKKPHLFLNNQQKTDYIEDMNKKYSSIPSHDLDYHLAEGHTFIGIICQNEKLRLMASKRFKDLHKSKIWKEMSDVSSSETVKQYADDIFHMSKKMLDSKNYCIELSDIINGNLINVLNKNNIKIEEENKLFYKEWLDHQTYFN